MNNSLVIDTKINASKVVQGCKGIIKALKNTAQNASQLASDMRTTEKSMSRTIARTQMAIGAFRELGKAISSALKEGLQNLAKFNDGNNSLNESVTMMRSALLQLKNALAAAFQPIITFVAPAISNLISLITQAVSSIGQLFAALSGQSTMYKAVKVTDDYAKSLKKAGGSAKSAKKQLAGIYDLNNISRNDSSGGGGGASAAPMFETVNTGVSAMADKIKSVFAPVIDSLKTAFSWLYDNILKPLGEWTVTEGIPAFFDALGGALELVSAVANTLGSWFADLWDKFLAPAAAWAGDAIVAFLETVGKVMHDVAQNQTAVNILAGVAAVIGTIAVAIGAWNVAQAILNGLLAANPITWVILGITALIAAIVLAITYWDEIEAALAKGFEHLKELGNTFKEAFVGAFTAAWNSVKGVINSVLAGIEKMVNGVISGINLMVSALNMIHFDIPDWVPALGGKSFGFNFDPVKSISLPRLASGTVVPRQSREFAAILGDNNRETEVVSPLSTMKQALKEALAEANVGKQPVHTHVYLEGDAAGVFRLVRDEEERNYNATGNMAFVH